MSLEKEYKQQVIDEFKRTDGDTGSPEVQIAILTARINHLTDHLKLYKRDYHSRLGMFKLIGRRRKLMKYLHKKDYNKYREVISRLGIRDPFSRKG